jgi:hypothetical protein
LDAAAYLGRPRVVGPAEDGVEEQVLRQDKGDGRVSRPDGFDDTARRSQPGPAAARTKR